MIQTERVTPPLLLFLGGLLAVGCLVALGPRAGQPAAAPLLSPQALRALAGGFAPALADIDWIRAAQVSSGALDGPGADALFRLLDRVTVLDPGFQPAYHFGALLLSIGGRRPDLSDRLLLRARSVFPQVWSFPFYLAFNAFYHRTDFTTSAAYLDQAAVLPGAPPFLADLARRFRDESQNRATARELIQRMLRVTQDPVLRRRLAERLGELEGAP
jgi:hypothetical protein